MWIDLGEMFVWFCVSAGIMAFGIFLAVVGITLNYFRGTKVSRAPLMCAILAGLSAVALWLIVAFVDHPCSIVFSGITTVATLAAISTWLNRSEF
jgi:hypothetical protein